MRDTLFQGDPFTPRSLPTPQTAAARPGAELPYVLFSEEGDPATEMGADSQAANLEWVRINTAAACWAMRAKGMHKASRQFGVTCLKMLWHTVHAGLIPIGNC